MIEVETNMAQLRRMAARLEQAAGLTDSPLVRGALFAAAETVVDAGRSNLSARLKGTGRGNLINSMMARVKRNKPGSLAGFMRSRVKGDTGGGNHAHLVDRGTRDRRGRGRMPANRFWTDAEASTAGSVKTLVERGLRAALDGWLA